MTVIKGEGGGLLFRKNDSTSFGYRFFVGQKNSDLNYDTKHIAGDFVGFKVKLSNLYLLTAIARGNSISLYVDKQWLTTVEDQTSSSGAIGIMAWDNDSPAEVVYNDAKVWAL